MEMKARPLQRRASGGVDLFNEGLESELPLLSAASQCLWSSMAPPSRRARAGQLPIIGYFIGGGML